MCLLFGKYALVCDDPSSEVTLKCQQESNRGSAKFENRYANYGIQPLKDHPTNGGHFRPSAVLPGVSQHCYNDKFWHWYNNRPLEPLKSKNDSIRVVGASVTEECFLPTLINMSSQAGTMARKISNPAVG
jgi:hypothetical protein